MGGEGRPKRIMGGAFMIKRYDHPAIFQHKSWFDFQAIYQHKHAKRDWVMGLTELTQIRLGR
jgi:hypothetical protein